MKSKVIIIEEKLTQCLSTATESLNSFSKSLGELRERLERFRKECDKDITEERS